MKQILFFDVDGTLFDNKHHKVPQSAIDTLQILGRHYLLGIATGRSLHTLSEFKITEMYPWDVYVCNNGQLAYDANHKEIYRNPLKPEIVDNFLSIAKQRKEPLLLGTPYWYQFQEVNDYQREAHDYFNLPIPQAIGDIHQDVFMICLYGPKGFNYEAYQMEGVDLLPGQSTYCDVIAKGSGKEVGIAKVMNILHADTYVAFGDSDNDLGMLKNADYAIVLGQGSESAKQLADYITKPVDEDGIAYAYAHCEIFDTIRRLEQKENNKE
ncbi:MAG: HAD-IIB family hydrolase [Erysipelotrichaceae bacterium]|nr:HAD-IIB family hydrolase [Erysipelotrichaceae bacterium]